MRTETFAVGNRDLEMDLFEPAAPVDGPRRPAVVFFHGGAWKLGHRAQFHPQCQQLAAVGYVTATASYVLDGTIADCVESARAAVDHLITNADRLGIDPDRIVVSGGSAGGHLAACLASCPTAVPSKRPAAVVLFNPCVDFAGAITSLRDLAPDVGADPVSLSPIDQDLTALPPTIIFHGTHDSIVPIETVRAFRDAAAKAGAHCELIEYEDREHAFFNPAPPELRTDPDTDDYATTMAATEAFLHQALPAAPNTDHPASAAARPASR